MLRNLFVFCLIFVFTAAACTKSPMVANAADNGNGQVASESVNVNAAEKTVDAKATDKDSNGRIFLGYLSDKRVKLNLVRGDGKISGTYQYEKVGKDLNLSGTIDGAGNFTLQETDAAGGKTGEWKGTWKEVDGRATLAGKWKSPKGGDALDFNADELKTEFAGGAKITTKTANEENKAKFYEISAEYPELSGVDAATAAKFNQASKKIADDNNREFKKNLADITTPEDLKNYKENGISLYDETSYGIKLANDDVISVMFTDSNFQGGAHGSSITTTLNFDVKNNRVLKLADLFEPNSNYLKTLSELSTADLKVKLKKDDMLDNEMLGEGTSPKEENFKSWNLTKKGLLITFDAYQVAAYAAGPQEVTIPYAKLEKILRKDGVTADIAK